MYPYELFLVGQNSGHGFDRTALAIMGNREHLPAANTFHHSQRGKSMRNEARALGPSAPRCMSPQSCCRTRVGGPEGEASPNSDPFASKVLTADRQTSRSVAWQVFCHLSRLPHGFPSSGRRAAPRHTRILRYVARGPLFGASTTSGVPIQHILCSPTLIALPPQRG